MVEKLRRAQHLSGMSVQELKKAYDELPDAERLLFAHLIAADQLVHDAEFATTLGQRHQAMEEGKKWSHADLVALNEQLTAHQL